MVAAASTAKVKPTTFRKNLQVTLKTFKTNKRLELCAGFQPKFQRRARIVSSPIVVTS
jgi:hypothetical protein